MKKKNLLMILLGGMVMMPTTAKAQSNGDDNNQLPGKNRSPAQNPYAYITYDETAGMAYACFVSAVDGAEVVVYRDGEVVDSLVCWQHTALHCKKNNQSGTIISEPELRKEGGGMPKDLRIRQ